MTRNQDKAKDKDMTKVSLVIRQEKKTKTKRQEKMRDKKKTRQDKDRTGLEKTQHGKTHVHSEVGRLLPL